MRLNYNFAFKDSKLTPWERPSPPNLLISDASLDKKLKFILKQFNSNKELYYPSTLILILTLSLQTFNFYPKSLVRKFESDHNNYQNIVNKLENLNSSKRRFNKIVKSLDKFFTQPTTSYLFSYYLQESIPKGVQINSYSFSDNGFEINLSAFNIDSFNEFLTLLIESPVVLKDSVIINQLSRKELANSNNFMPLPDLELEIYGEVKKLNVKLREDLYVESNAQGLLKKLRRFNYLKQKLGS